MSITFLECLTFGCMVLMLISAWVYRFELTIDNPFVDWNKTGLFTSMHLHCYIPIVWSQISDIFIYISTDHFLWSIIRHLWVDLVWRKCILLHFHCIIFEPSGNTRLINNTKLRLFTSCGQHQNLFDPIYLI